MQAGKAQSLYGLDCPEIETRCGEIFRTHPYRPCGSSGLLYKGQRIIRPPVQWATGLLPGGKVPRGVALTANPHLALRLKKV